MNIRTKSQLKGRKFRALRVITSGFTIEDIPRMRDHFREKIDAIDGAEMTETETAFEFNNGQFVLKPKVNRETVGVLDCRASFATFDGVRIDYTDIAMHDGLSSFDTPYAQYSIHAEID